MDKNDVSSKKLISMDEIRGLLHENAERGFMHTTYLEESKRFHLLMQGDMRAVDESARLLDSNIQGTLSKNPIRNMRYLFIVNTGLLTRYAIEAGIPQETVYSVSDLYYLRIRSGVNKGEVNNSVLNESKLAFVFIRTICGWSVTAGSISCIRRGGGVLTATEYRDHNCRA